MAVSFVSPQTSAGSFVMLAALSVHPVTSAARFADHVPSALRFTPSRAVWGEQYSLSSAVQPDTSSDASWLLEQFSVSSAAQSDTSSVVSGFQKQYSSFSAAQPDTSSLVISSFNSQLRYVSFVFFDTSSSVSWLLEQFSSSSAVKCSMPVRLEIYWPLTFISFTSAISSEERELSSSLSKSFTYA